MKAVETRETQREKKNNNKEKKRDRERERERKKAKEKETGQSCVKKNLSDEQRNFMFLFEREKREGKKPDISSKSFPIGLIY